MIERRIRAGKVFEVQISDDPTPGEIRGALIRREVSPTEDELWEMELARRAMLHIMARPNEGAQMITTTYQCDKCGDAVKNRESLWMLSILVDTVAHGHHGHPHPEKTMHVCRSCLTLLGFRRPSTPAEPPLPPPPSVEDLIREIAEQVVEEKTGAS